MSVKMIKRTLMITKNGTTEKNIYRVILKELNNLDKLFETWELEKQTNHFVKNSGEKFRLKRINDQMTSYYLVEIIPTTE